VGYSSLQTFLSTDTSADQRGLQCNCTAKQEEEQQQQQQQQHIRDIKESSASRDIILKITTCLQPRLRP
jgi:hypothetical protein